MSFLLISQEKIDGVDEKRLASLIADALISSIDLEHYRYEYWHYPDEEYERIQKMPWKG